jgi:hypothetical protein
VVCTLGGDFSAGVALPELHLPHHLITSYISTLSYRKASMRHVPDNKLRLSRHHCQSNSEARKSLTSHPAGTLNPMCYKPTCIRSLAHKLDRRVANYTCQKALQCYGGITFHYLLLLFLSSRPGRGPCGERLAYSQVYSQSCLGLSSLLTISQLFLPVVLTTISVAAFTVGYNNNAVCFDVQYSCFHPVCSYLSASLCWAVRSMLPINVPTSGCAKKGSFRAQCLQCFPL